MNEILSSALLIIGATFALLAGVGMVRMPDLFTRMQASTKASTLGIGCIVGAVAIHFGELGITTRALATMVFVFLTAPVAAHMIARAAYFVGVPLWEGTIIDELRGHYDRRTHRLARPDDPYAVLPMTVDLNRLAGHVVIVGYQGRGSLGRRLVDGAESVSIFGEKITVRAQVHALGGFSAHAGQTDLMRWIGAIAPGRPRVVLIHGEDGPRTTLAGLIRERYRLPSELPKQGDVIEL